MIGPQWLQERMRCGLDSGCVFNVKSTGSASELGQHMRERVKGASQAFGLRSRKDGMVFEACESRGEQKFAWDIISVTR